MGAILYQPQCDILLLDLHILNNQSTDIDARTSREECPVFTKKYLLKTYYNDPVRVSLFKDFSTMCSIARPAARRGYEDKLVQSVNANIHKGKMFWEVIL